MTLRQYFLIFRAHRKLALSVMLATVAIAVPAILLLPKPYTASTSLAAAVANAFAQAYVEAVTELKVEPARQYARWFGEQGKSLRENLEAAVARLADSQQEKRMIAKDETLDVETLKLNELTSQLTVVQ